MEPEDQAIQIGTADVEFNNRVLSSLAQIAAGKAGELKEHVGELEEVIEELQERVAGLEKPDERV